MPKNWTDWIYFNGGMMAADKLANINLANINWGYIVTKMGCFGVMLFNPLTTGGGDDKFIQIGVDLANEGY